MMNSDGVMEPQVRRTDESAQDVMVSLKSGADVKSLHSSSHLNKRDRQVVMMNSDGVMEPQVRRTDESAQDVMVSLKSGVSGDSSSDGEVTDDRTRHYSSLNSLRPFYTAQKPTCGYSFSWDTDHKHKPTGLQTHNPRLYKHHQ